MKKKPEIENNPGSINVLSISAVEDDRNLLENTFSNNAMLDTKVRSEPKWLLHKSATPSPALAVPRENHIPMVLCDWDVAGGWRELLEQVTLSYNPPSLIVTCRLAGAYES